MPVSFPICLLLFLAGWLSGSLFILVSLDPKGLPALLSPMDSKFTDLQMKMRTKQMFLADSGVSEENQYTSLSASTVSEEGHHVSKIMGGKQDFGSSVDSRQPPTNSNVHPFTGGLTQKNTQFILGESRLGKFVGIISLTPHSRSISLFSVVFNVHLLHQLFY